MNILFCSSHDSCDKYSISSNVVFQTLTCKCDGVDDCCFLLIDWVYWGYNPPTSLLITSCDICFCLSRTHAGLGAGHHYLLLPDQSFGSNQLDILEILAGLINKDYSKHHGTFLGGGIAFAGGWSYPCSFLLMLLICKDEMATNCELIVYTRSPWSVITRVS